jgi:hypothetical protein
MFTKEVIIERALTLPRSGVFFGRKQIARLLAQIFMPKPEDTSDRAMELRAFIINSLEKHENLDKASDVMWKQPFVDYLVLAIDFDNYLSLCLRLGIADPFQLLKDRWSLTDTTIAFWASGWKIPPIRTSLEQYFREALNDPHIMFFWWITDDWLDRHGFIKSRPDYPGRWFLTERSLCWPLAKFVRRRRQKVAGDWIFKIDFDSDFKEKTLKFAQDRWRFLQYLDSLNLCGGRVQ